MGKFGGILNADLRNIRTCQLFSFCALFDAPASPVFMQRNEKRTFVYTMFETRAQIATTFPPVLSAFLNESINESTKVGG